jgi:hypothetical protein
VSFHPEGTGAHDVPLQPTQFFEEFDEPLVFRDSSRLAVRVRLIIIVIVVVIVVVVVVTVTVIIVNRTFVLISKGKFVSGV